MKRKEKIKDFKKKSKKELSKILNEKRSKLRQFKFDLSAGNIKNVKEIRENRKDIARIKTFLNQK